MRDVAVLGVGMHPFGKFADKSVTDLCRTAVVAALADAGVAWREIEAVAAASSRFSGGKGWGLNGNDVVEDMGSSGIPVYNLSAGCSAGGNAFNIGYTLVASGLARRRARRRRREDAEGLHPDLRRRGSDGPRVPAAALCRRLGARLLGDALPPPHGGSRHHRGAPREDRGEGARELGPQSVRALPQALHASSR